MTFKNDKKTDAAVDGFEELSLDELDGVRGGFRANPEHMPELFQDRSAPVGTPHLRATAQRPHVRALRTMNGRISR
jgi:hypothetical protein